MLLSITSKAESSIAVFICNFSSVVQKVTIFSIFFGFIHIHSTSIQLLPLVAHFAFTLGFLNRSRTMVKMLFILRRILLHLAAELILFCSV